MNDIISPALLAWCEEHYVNPKDILEDEDGNVYVMVEGEEGIEKLSYNHD